MRVMLVMVLLAGCGVAPAWGQAGQFDGAVRAAAELRLASRGPASATARPTFAPLAPPRTASRRRSLGETLMLIGGGAVVVGALAGGSGGTVLIVGGVVCAGYGFYLYQQPARP